MSRTLRIFSCDMEGREGGREGKWVGVAGEGRVEARERREGGREGRREGGRGKCAYLEGAFPGVELDDLDPGEDLVRHLFSSRVGNK